ncbi:hypothetical protein TNCV_2895171 [Trichonephila clavipes]|nr:hypothetical protein TNCV_2895171 [Trichonephila clavipes]
MKLKENILRLQAENKKQYNKHRKPAYNYKPDKKKRGPKMSGSQKRKEKEYNINSKYAKLDNFLISASSSSCASSRSSNARKLDEQGQAHPGIHKRRIW